MQPQYANPLPYLNSSFVFILLLEELYVIVQIHNLFDWMFPLWGTFSDTVHCWSYRSRCKLPCMVLREAEFQLWQWIGRWHYFTPFAFSFFSQFFLTYQTFLIRLLFYHLSGGKNCVLFSFHTIPGAIRNHVLSPRLRWGFYMASKHKQAAHSCLCTGKGRKG